MTDYPAAATVASNGDDAVPPVGLMQVCYMRTFVLNDEIRVPGLTANVLFPFLRLKGTFLSPSLIGGEILGYLSFPFGVLSDPVAAVTFTHFLYHSTA